MQEHVKQKEKNARKSDTGERRVLSKAQLITYLEEVAWICGAWLLGQARLAFGTFPLGLALLCASGHHTLSILIGLLAVAAGQMESPALYIVTYLAAALIRVVSSLLLEPEDANKKWGLRIRERLLWAERGPAASHTPAFPDVILNGMGTRLARVRAFFSESLTLRMASGATCALIVGLWRVFTGGFQYYDLFATVFAVLVTPAAVPVYAVALDRHASGTGMVLRLSQAALAFSFVFAATTVRVVGLPLAPVLALLITLWITSREGIAVGAVFGVLVGIAYRPMHAPAYLLAALVLGMLKGQKQAAAVPSACMAALAWTLYADRIDQIFTLLPSCLLAGGVFGLISFLGASEPNTSEDHAREVVRHRLEGSRHRDANDRFRGISEAFSSLSEMFYNLSDRFRRPGTLDLRQICDRSFDRFCADCPNKTVCWGLEYNGTLDSVNRLISALHTKGRVTRSCMAPTLLRRCDCVDAILQDINRECAKLTGELLKNNRTEIFAMDYEAAASIINDALEEDDCEYRFDAALEQKIDVYLHDAGVSAHGVTVYGKRRRQIVVRGVDVGQARVTVETLRADLGEMCGMELEKPTFELDGASSNMILRAAQKIAVTGAQKGISAEGGVSGDSLNLFSNKKDFFYALINDGMGAGHEAAMTSRLCSVFLEKMLRAGNRANTSLRMLNNLIRSRTSDSTRECSSTVDLLELDLMTGEASFIKSGAAPSLVVRQGGIQLVSSPTAPIGIISALDAQATPLALQAGDLVVMISDGILEKDPECEWLTSYLQAKELPAPDVIAAEICRYAAGNEKHDDCSAIVLRIKAANAPAEP